MNRLQLSVPVIACIASLYTAGCAAEVKATPPPRAEVVVAAPPVKAEVVVAAPQPAVVVAQPGVVEVVPQEVVVKAKPPVEKVEIIPVAPSANHMWIKGHWHWDGAVWVWRPGRYEVRRVGFQWYPAQYVERGGGIVYVDGHWGH